MLSASAKIENKIVVYASSHADRSRAKTRCSWAAGGVMVALGGLAVHDGEPAESHSAPQRLLRRVLRPRPQPLRAASSRTPRHRLYLLGVVPLGRSRRAGCG